MEGVYFYETFNSKDNVKIREEVIYQGPEEQTESPTKDEAWQIIRTLENNNSQGEDSISAELVKYGDEKLWEETHALIEVIRA